MIHSAYQPTTDPDRNWITRRDAERARLAMEKQRHDRNAELAAFWYEIGGAVMLGVVLVAGLRRAVNAGLFSWL